MSDEIDFANPPIEMLLRANPMMQWRTCHDCETTDLFRDNMLPACKCRACGSSDTRHILRANQLLHRIPTTRKVAADEAETN